MSREFEGYWGISGSAAERAEVTNSTNAARAARMGQGTGFMKPPRGVSDPASISAHFQEAHEKANGKFRGGDGRSI